MHLIEDKLQIPVVKHNMESSQFNNIKVRLTSAENQVIGFNPEHSCRLTSICMYSVSHPKAIQGMDPTMPCTVTDSSQLNSWKCKNWFCYADCQLLPNACPLRRHNNFLKQSTMTAPSRTDYCPYTSQTRQSIGHTPRATPARQAQGGRMGGMCLQNQDLEGPNPQH